MNRLVLEMPYEKLEVINKVIELEGQDISAVASDLLDEWAKNEVERLYKDGEITINKAAELLGISVWETIDFFKSAGVPLQIGRIKHASSI